MSLNIRIVENDFFRYLEPYEYQYLNESFYFYNTNGLATLSKSKSKCIVAFNGDRKVKNIIGLMKVSRYRIDDNEALREEYKYDFNLIENSEISITDTYVHIEFIEVKDCFKNQGVGTKMYSFLEDNLTSLDIIYESYRTIEGKKADLLAKVQKCMAVDDFDLIYYS